MNAEKPGLATDVEIKVHGEPGKKSVTVEVNGANAEASTTIIAEFTGRAGPAYAAALFEQVAQMIREGIAEARGERPRHPLAIPGRRPRGGPSA